MIWKSQTVLLSGGLDSAVLLAYVHDACKTRALFVDYGQRPADAEGRAAVIVARHYGIELEHVEIPKAIFAGSGSALLGEGPMPVGREEGLSAAYVPGRNAVMISLAAAYAAAAGEGGVIFGANADDAANFPDCRPDFIRAMAALVKTSTAGRVELHAPFLSLSKAEVVELGRRLDVPLWVTSSCYLGGECGECPACTARAEALSSAKAAV